MPTRSRQAIAGLKYSQGLCLLRLGQSWGADAAHLLAELARQRVNLVFAGGGAEADGPGDIWLCLHEEYLVQAWQTARTRAEDRELTSPEVLAPVALVTIYPLGPGLSLHARVLVGLAGAGLTPLALGTSLSALVVALPQDELAKALDALQEFLELPSGMEPAPQPVKAMPVAPRRQP